MPFVGDSFVEGNRTIMVDPNAFFNQVKAEARKVVWPTRQETVTTAIFVAVLMALLSVFFLGIDTLFGYCVRLLLSLA